MINLSFQTIFSQGSELRGVNKEYMKAAVLVGRLALAVIAVIGRVQKVLKQQ